MVGVSDGLFRHRMKVVKGNADQGYACGVRLARALGRNIFVFALMFY
jgi:hypothetical protein